MFCATDMDAYCSPLHFTVFISQSIKHRMWVLTVCVLRWKNWWVRGILTLAMISFFFIIIYLGPMVLMLIVSDPHPPFPKPSVSQFVSRSQIAPYTSPLVRTPLLPDLQTQDRYTQSSDGASTILRTYLTDLQKQKVRMKERVRD